jgi:hypothetical protein
MIEDLFFKRYSNIEVFGSHEVSAQMQLILSQSIKIFVEDVATPLKLDEEFYIRVHRKLTRECVVEPLPAGPSACLRVQSFLYSSADERAIAYGRVDSYMKIRISLVELLFRNAMMVLENYRRMYEIRQAAREQVRSRLGLEKQDLEELMDKSALDARERALAEGIAELNARFRISDIPLHYNNGFIQVASDEKIEKHVVEPFWSITSGQKWVNVDHDMKEAIDRMNNGKPDAVLYAMMALESTIKIISDCNGWTRGKENGAHAFIGNLGSEANGRFVAVWEADALKALFSKLRNPHGHGPGSEPQPSLNSQQTEWAIETCMSWIKSLIRRM